MKNILIAGAGRSASSLIQYLAKVGEQYQWRLTIADSDVEMAQSKAQAHPCAVGIGFDVLDEKQRAGLVSESDLVISMLPAYLHNILSVSCLQFRKSMLTASYVSDEMRAMDADLKKQGVLFLNECGLDPGIDHMTAVQTIQKIKEKGGRIQSFRSFTGGLIAPEYDDNPWGYKFTWNPRNVVLAGQGGAARFMENGQLKAVPYHKLFSRYETVLINGLGDFEGYPNRDSLKYKNVYGLEHIPTMIRGTLRKSGFCDAWNALVQLGMTDDSYVIERGDAIACKEFTNIFLPADQSATIEDNLCNYLGIARESGIFEKLEWLGLFSEKHIGMQKGSPAALLQKILEEKWRLKEEDKDLIVMQHLISYELEGKYYQATYSIVAMGDDAVQTAMAKTVGWPLAIAAKLILTGKIKEKGLLIPIKAIIYEPILEELGDLGIKFMEEEKEISPL